MENQKSYYGNEIDYSNDVPCESCECKNYVMQSRRRERIIREDFDGYNPEIPCVCGHYYDEHCEGE
jgi:hypothetical protein